MAINAQVDTKSGMKAGAGGTLLKMGAALATGGLSEAADAATGGAIGSISKIGEGIGSKLKSLTDMTDTPIMRRYQATKDVYG